MTSHSVQRRRVLASRKLRRFCVRAVDTATGAGMLVVALHHGDSRRLLRISASPPSGSRTVQRRARHSETGYKRYAMFGTTKSSRYSHREPIWPASSTTMTAPATRELQRYFAGSSSQSSRRLAVVNQRRLALKFCSSRSGRASSTGRAARRCPRAATSAGRGHGEGRSAVTVNSRKLCSTLMAPPAKGVRFLGGGSLKTGRDTP